jgi:hypothetical protein
MTIVFWIDGYSNSGSKIKTASLKNQLALLQARYPEKNYYLRRANRRWFIAEGVVADNA